MDENIWLAEQFETRRDHLHAVAYRMLGSLAEADDALQDAWLNISRAGSEGVHNLAGFMTTVVARVCLDMLRARKARREESHGVDTPEPRQAVDASTPEQELMLASAVGLALLVVLERLEPAERVAFVLHDMFAMPFEELAPIVDRTPSAARQLASRARRRLQGGDRPRSDALALERQREVVEAYLGAARHGDLNALLAVLAPDVVLRADAASSATGAPLHARGNDLVARQALGSSGRARYAQAALVDGKVALLFAPRGRLAVVLKLEVQGEQVVAIEVVGEPARLGQLDITLLDEAPSAAP